ncbi:Cellobiose phosphotransferase system YdjC-like protein [Acidisarcina polymorpha]|uniref:Cellobiose phosphotransferase system YdjC-like protein n=1 Tax=Acidisarcina polymorpha TaxID=2211140 RepID=A0A2Z5FUY5_9BACT|nr:ChbG/HpnK family deacetylase [Acidisarcina polymorpha]AXC10562.1 Cellobiose phosphotransferase system YdjC-like protein [Acidisarcina polymorpha]
MKRLIINADDFGLTAGVNRAVLELARAGVLTSATLMAKASDTAEAAEAALRRPNLAVGCHVVLVDGTPVSAPDAIPTLIDPGSSRENPRFRSTLNAFISDLLRGRIREADIETEAVAQIRRLQQLDIAVSHVDTHKHTHAFPRVLRPLLRAAVLRHVACIRNPFEPEWSVAATGSASLLRRLQVRALQTQRRYFLAAAEHIGVFTTGGSIGVLATGTLDSSTLRRLLAAMPEGTWELVCHPGYADDALRAAGTRLLVSREVERQALLDTVPEAARDNVALIHYGNLKATSFLGVM